MLSQTLITLISLITVVGSLNSVSLLCKLPIDSLSVHSQCWIQSLMVTDILFLLVSDSRAYFRKQPFIYTTVWQ